MPDHKKKSTPQKKEKSRRFPSKNIKHDPNAESARAVFGLNTTSSIQQKDKHL